MKIYLLIPFTILLSTIFGCSNKEQSTEKTIQGPGENALTTDNKIDFSKTKVIKQVYVADRKGAKIKEKPVINSKNIGTYGFGTKLNVIEESEDWFGVKDRITREFFRNGSNIESTGWEKVYVHKNKTGSIHEITLIDADIDIISSITVNQKTEYFDTGKQLKKHLKIELIDKSFFISKKNNSIDFLTADTISKKNDTITLPCQNNEVKYIDKLNEEENRQKFQYIGQIKFLNQYILKGSYWEGLDYRFIDKTSGEETQIFGEYPNISPDKKHIICIYTNPYETTADLELYSIVNNQIHHELNVSFKYWMPTVEQNGMFWSSDGYLYLTVNHISSFWTESGDINNNCQYLRIKIL